MGREAEETGARDGSAGRTKSLGEGRTFCPERNFRAVMETMEAFIIPKSEGEEVLIQAILGSPLPL